MFDPKDADYEQNYERLLQQVNKDKRPVARTGVSTFRTVVPVTHAECPAVRFAARTRTR